MELPIMNKRESVMKKGRGKWIKLTDLEVKAVNAEFEKGTKERFAAIVEFSGSRVGISDPDTVVGFS